MNQNTKHEEETKLSCDCCARLQGSQTIICVPRSKKHTEEDVHIYTNVHVPVYKAAKLIIGCSIAVCILGIFFVTAAIIYQNLELFMKKQMIVVLNLKVGLTAATSDTLHLNIILQDEMNRLSTQCSMAGGASANCRGTEQLQEMKFAPGSELKILLDTNFSVLDLDGDKLNIGVALKDTVELGNGGDMKNKSLSSIDEDSDPLFISANDASVDTYDSIFTNDIETSGRLQEPKVDSVTDNSQPLAVSILFQADDPSGQGYGETDGMTMGRAKRSNRRGNEKLSGGRRGHLNNKRKNDGPLLIHFNGAVPELLVEDEGVIAPWHADEQGAGDFLLSKLQLREGNGAVEVMEKGLYYIYAQVYYMTTTESSNSFSVRLHQQGKSSPEELAVCSANTAVKQSMSEVSCFTSVVRFLNATDRVFLWQRERNRRIVLRNGFSFFGFVHLSDKRG